MGQALSSLWHHWFPLKEYKLCMVGLDNAGKTTTLYRLHLNETVRSQPTIGSNVETVQVNNLTFEIWDLGGQANLRPSWTTYFTGTDAVILVIDSTDRARISLVQTELQRLLANDTLAGACILIFANKQDIKDAMTPAEITSNLDLTSIKSHPWHIQASCAITGDGLQQGMIWLANNVKRKRAGA